MRNSGQVASQCGFLLYTKRAGSHGGDYFGSGVTVINSDAKPMVPSRNLTTNNSYPGPEPRGDNPHPLPDRTSRNPHPPSEPPGALGLDVFPGMSGAGRVSGALGEAEARAGVQAGRVAKVERVAPKDGGRLKAWRPVTPTGHCLVPVLCRRAKALLSR